MNDDFHENQVSPSNIVCIRSSQTSLQPFSTYRGLVKKMESECLHSGRIWGNGFKIKEGRFRSDIGKKSSLGL